VKVSKGWLNGIMQMFISTLTVSVSITFKLHTFNQWALTYTAAECVLWKKIVPDKQTIRDHQEQATLLMISWTSIVGAHRNTTQTGELHVPQ
jgi:hypothetical protein